MVAAGEAAYDPVPRKGAPPTNALIYWRKPDEWAQMIYEWVSRRAPRAVLEEEEEEEKRADMVDGW